MFSHPALRRSLLAALAAATAVVVPGVAAASVATCTDLSEDPYDAAGLQPGVATERGFCTPDGNPGGGDLDWLAFAAEPGHRYRIELVEGGAGLERAYLVIDEAYDGNSAFPQLTSESPHAIATSPLPEGTMTFSVTAVSADGVRLTGDDLGYSVLVTDLGDVAADPAPAVAAVTLAAATVRAGASTTALVVLDRPAPAGGATVRLSSSDARVTLPTSLTVPAGQDRASVAVASTRSRTRYTAAITASTAAGSVATTLHVR